MSNFDILNGMTGMKRNVILRLCDLLNEKTQNVKAILGMCTEHFPWKAHPYFLSVRKTYINISHSFRPDPIFSVQLSNTGCFFLDQQCPATVFMNIEIATGVWRWTVRITYLKDVDWSMQLDGEVGIGVAQKDVLDQCSGGKIGVYNKGASGFYFQINSDGTSYSWLRGTVEYKPNKHIPSVSVPNGSLVAAEADADGRTLVFFVEGKKVPWGISNIATPFHFGLAGCHASFESISFRHLHRPTYTPSYTHFQHQVH